MSGIEKPEAAALRALLAERGIALPDEEVAAGAAQAAGVQRALQRISPPDVLCLEPTAYPRFDDWPGSEGPS